MADIRPIYDQPPQTDRLPTPYSSVPYSPMGFGAGAGQGVEQLSGAFDQIALKAKADADASASIAAIGAAKGVLNSTILDPEKGYVATKGEAAISKRDDFLKLFNDGISKAEAALTNADQRRAALPHLLTIREEGLRHAYSHEAVQQEDVSKAAFAGTADQTFRTMQSVAGQPDELQKQVDDLRLLATAEGQRRFGNNPAAVQSVVAPIMQKAAIDTMEAATASNDPVVAKAAFDKVAPYLLNHERHYGALVTALGKQQEINQQAASVVAGAVTPVVVPGGQQIPRVDATKLSAAVLALPDSQYRDQTVKAIEQRQQVLDKVWNETVGQRVLSAQTQGTNAMTGEFNLSRVSVTDRLWLQQNAPDKLIALRTLDARARKIDSGDERRASKDALADLLLDMADPNRRGSFYGPLSAEAFNLVLNDQPLNGIDRKTAVVEYKKVKAEAGKVQDTVLSVVKETLATAFPTQPNQAKKYLPALVQDLHQFVDTEKARNNGKAPGDAEMRARALFMMSRPPGDHWWNSPDRRIEAAVNQSVDAAKTGTAVPPAQAPVAAATPAATPAPTPSYRYSKDRTRRFPVDDKGNRTGPTEDAP